MLNNRRQELFVVGTAISSEFVYMLGPGSITPDPKHFGVFYLKQTFAEDVFDFGGAANQVLGRLDAAESAPVREVLRRAENMLAGYGVFTTTPLEDQSSNRFLSQEIRRPADLRLHHAGDVPRRRGAGAQRAADAGWPSSSDRHRHAQGPRLYRRPSLLALLKNGLVVGIAGGMLGCFLGCWHGRGMTIVYRGFFEFPEFDNHSTPAPLPGVGGQRRLRGRWAASAAAGPVLRLHPAEAMRPSRPARGATSGWNASAGSGPGSSRVADGAAQRLPQSLRTIAGLFAAAHGRRRAGE